MFIFETDFITRTAASLEACISNRVIIKHAVIVCCPIDL